MTDYIQVMTTTDNKESSQKIAKMVIEKRLAACAQIIGPVISTYWWNDDINEDEEWLLVMKTVRDLYSDLEKTILNGHPYEVPEILAVPVIDGNKSYLEWLGREVKS